MSAPGITGTESFGRAGKVAEAVLYEGYVLYPYRASARKNKLRWQFGVVVPRAFAEADSSEDWVMQTECPVEVGRGTRLDVKVRCLRVQQRRVEKALDGDAAAHELVDSLEVGGTLLTTWDEAVEEEIDIAGINVDELFVGERVVPVELVAALQMEVVRDASGRAVGRITRRRHRVSGVVRIAAQRQAGPFSVATVSVRIENLTEWSEAAPSVSRRSGHADRDEVMRHSLVAVHTLMAVTNGAFISLLDPPEFAKAAVAACVNLHTWPVLIGDPVHGVQATQARQRDVMLSSPVTLYDYPEVAPESPGEFYDSTEIDEILALRVMTLTDEEKREARSTDARAAAIIDRCDDMPTEVFERLHGAVRYLRDCTQSRVDDTSEPQEKPWWDPGVDASVNPFEDRVRVGRVEVGRGSRVRLRPSRRADAHDIFLSGRDATIQGVFQDVDGNTQVAVSVLDDPMADFAQWHGRFLYFYPDEIEPLDEMAGS